MARLTIEAVESGKFGMVCERIGGFNEGELNELKSMEHHEAEEKLLTMLDDRNDKTGTCWGCGNGVYGIWFDNEAAYVNIGNTCD